MKLLYFLTKKLYSKKTLAIGVLLSILNFISCQTLPDKKPLIFIQKIDKAPILLKVLVDRVKNLNDFKSFAQTVVNKNDHKQSIKQVIVIRGTDSIRIDTLSFFNQPFIVFIQKKNQTFLFDTKTKKYYRDEKALKLIEKLLGMKINFEEFIPLVSANVPFVDKLIPLDSWISEDSSAYKLLLKLKNSKIAFILEIDAQTQIPRKITKLLENKEVYNITWENFKTVGEYDLPHLLEWSNIKGNESLIVKLKKPIPNSGIKGSVFNLNTPLN